jgi:rare lipoprotein A
MKKILIALIMAMYMSSPMNTGISNVPVLNPSPTDKPVQKKKSRIRLQPKPKPRPYSKPKKPRKPKKTGIQKVFTVTAYTNQQGSGDTYITASGTKTVEGRTIAAPSWIPFGTRIYIPYFHQTFICEDRGGAIKGNHIDVYMESEQKAVEFGVKKLQIEILPNTSEE